MLETDNVPDRDVSSAPVPLAEQHPVAAGVQGGRHGHSLAQVQAEEVLGEDVQGQGEAHAIFEHPVEDVDIWVAREEGRGGFGDGSLDLELGAGLLGGSVAEGGEG